MKLWDQVLKSAENIRLRIIEEYTACQFPIDVRHCLADEIEEKVS